MKLKFIISLFVVFLMMSSLQVSGDQLADIETAGKLIVGSDTTYPPFESIDGSDAVGFDVDIAVLLADYMGVDLVYQTTAWDTIIPSLENKEFDIIISAMTITDERDKVIDFSQPYYNSSQAILVATGNPKNIATEADLNVTGVKIGVQTGTTSDIYATESLGNADIIRLGAFTDLYQKLDLGEIDVILGDAPVVGYASSTGAVGGEVITTFGSVEAFGIGVRSGETGLLDKINAFLDSIFADGTYNNLTKTWFGYEAVDVPAKETPVDGFFAVMGLFVTVAIVIKRRK